MQVDTLEHSLPTPKPESSMDLRLALSQHAYESEEEAELSQSRSDTIVPNSEPQDAVPSAHGSMDLRLTNTLNVAEYNNLSSDKPQQQQQHPVQQHHVLEEEKKPSSEDVDQPTVQHVFVAKATSPKKQTYKSRIASPPPKVRRASASREMKELELKAKKEALRDMMRTSPSKPSRLRKSLPENEEDDDEANDEKEDAMEIDTSPTQIKSRKKKLVLSNVSGWTPKASKRSTDNSHYLSDTEPTTEERDIPIGKKKKPFFEGIKVVLTGKVDKKSLTNQITSFGGQVLEIQNNMLASEVDALRNNQIVLVADKPGRTFKYMFALALDIQVSSPF